MDPARRGRHGEPVAIACDLYESLGEEAVNIIKTDYAHATSTGSRAQLLVQMILLPIFLTPFMSVKYFKETLQHTILTLATKWPLWML
jgi:hypothetical protein